MAATSPACALQSRPCLRLESPPLPPSAGRRRALAPANEGTSELTSECYWAEIGCSDITRSIETLADPVTGATDYLRLTFTGGEVVPVGEDSGDMQVASAVTFGIFSEWGAQLLLARQWP
jgi:hypothetical protein